MKFEKVTASCIVVILFHAGFELILLCDIWGGEGWGWGWGGGGAILDI